MKKLILGLLTLLMLFSQVGCTSKNETIDIEPDEFWIDEEELEEIDDGLGQTLLEDYDNGVLSGDDVVSTTLSELFDNEEQTNDCDLDTLILFAEEHWDELESQTQLDYYEKIFLGGIDFEYGEPETLFQKLVDPLFEDVYADETITNKLNYVIASEEKHFLIWYTTSGKNAITHDKAKAIAASLEQSIDAYDELYGTTYCFNVQKSITGSLLTKQKIMLKKAGLDEKLMQQAMSVYIYDDGSKDGTLARYTHTDKDWSVVLDLLATAYDAVPEGIAVVPFITIKPSSLTNQVNCDQLVNHEIFHHYQQQIFKDYTDQKKIQLIASEATAHLSSALITQNKNETNTTLNDWASLYSYYTANWKTYQRIKGVAHSGYLLYPVLYNYVTYVPNGLDKIADCLYKGNFFAALQEKTNIAYRNKMMRMLLLHTLNNNYDNQNLKNNYKYKIPYTYLKKDDKGNYQDVSDSLDPMGIRYYRIIKAKGANMDFVFDSIGTNVDAVLLAKVNGRYQIIQSLTRSIGKLSTIGFDDISEFFVVCFDTAFAADKIVEDAYSFTTVLTKVAKTEIPVETPVDGYSDVIVVEEDKPITDNPSDENPAEGLPLDGPVIEVGDEDNIIDANQVVLDDEIIKVVAKKLQIKNGMPLLYLTLTNKKNATLSLDEFNFRINEVLYDQNRVAKYDGQGNLIDYAFDIEPNKTVDLCIAIGPQFKNSEKKKCNISAFEAYGIAAIGCLNLAFTLWYSGNDGTEYLDETFGLNTKYYSDALLTQPVLQNYLSTDFTKNQHKITTVYLNTNVNKTIGDYTIYGDAIVLDENGSLQLLVDLTTPKDVDGNEFTIRVTHINGIELDGPLGHWFSQYGLYNEGSHRIVKIDLYKYTDEAVRSYWGMQEVKTITYEMKLGSDIIVIEDNWGVPVNKFEGDVIYDDNDIVIVLTGINKMYDGYLKQFKDNTIQFFFVVQNKSQTAKSVSMHGVLSDDDDMYVHVQIEANGTAVTQSYRSNYALENFESTELSVSIGEIDNYSYHVEGTAVISR